MSDQAMTTLTSVPRGHLPMMDGARAVAAVMVLLTHAGAVSGATGKYAVGPFLARGDWGVALFFVLSGFLLTRPWVSWRAGKSAPSVATYLRKRAVRILPAYWLVLMAVLVLVPATVDAGGVISNATLTQIYTGDLLQGFYQSWSLCTEVAFYAVLPLLAPLLVRGSARRSLIAIAAAAAVTPIWIMMCKEWFVDSMHPFAVVWLPGHMDWFCAGMALAVVERRMRAGQFPRLLVGANRWLLASAVAFALALTPLGGPLGFEYISGPAAILKEFLYAATAFFLVGAMLQPRAEFTIWGRTLNSRVMTWAGVISYGFFLWHVLVLEEVRNWLGMPELGGGFAVSLALTFVVTLVISQVSFVVLERPLMRRFGGASLRPGSRGTLPPNDTESGHDETIEATPRPR